MLLSWPCALEFQHRSHSWLASGAIRKLCCYKDEKIVPSIRKRYSAHHECTIGPLPLAIIGETTFGVLASSPGLVKALGIRRKYLWISINHVRHRRDVDREVLEVGAR